MSVKLLTEHHLELLSLKDGCTGSSESILVKMPHCWKSHATAYLYISGDSDLAGYFTVEQSGAILLNPGFQEGTYDLSVKAEITQPVRVVTNVPITIILGKILLLCYLFVQ